MHGMGHFFVVVNIACVSPVLVGKNLLKKGDRCYGQINLPIA